MGKRRGHFGAWRAAAAVVAVLCAQLLSVAPARADAVDEELLRKVTAAFVLNLVRYTEWPDHRFADAEAPIVIGIVGPADVTPYIQAIVTGERIEGRPIRVVNVPPPATGGDAEARAAALRRFDESLRPLHLVFLPRAVAGGDVGRRVVAQRLGGLLTVGEGDDFAARGGMIGLYIRRERLVFDARVDAMERVSVKLSSKVLRLAERVLGERK